MKAAVAQLDYRIVDKVNLTLGYRYSDDEKTDENGMTYAFWEGSSAWYNGEHEPTGVRAHQSNDLTNNMDSLYTPVAASACRLFSHWAAASEPNTYSPAILEQAMSVSALEYSEQYSFALTGVCSYFAKQAR